VVAVVVAHDPGPWFEEVLDGLASQDYPNLRVLVLDTGARDLTARVGARVPGAYIRRVVARHGYGAAANEALRLVEGAGFFLFTHDDVALEPSAVRLLVEETYRSNAGIAGPKLTEWNDSSRLASVGIGADKFGELAPAVEPGEIDQEQHDAVRDVFCLSSACLLVRADLLRTIGGFDSQITFDGDELDICWRAHVGGARVLVVPAARARHRAEHSHREDTDDHGRLRERHRLRTVMSSYSGWHLLLVLPQYLVVTFVEAIASVLTGHAARARALVSAWPSNVASTREILAKRRGLREFRQVGDPEVRRLQARGSARLAGFLRGHSTRREGREPFATRVTRSVFDMVRTGANRASYGTWAALVIAFIVGSRTLFSDGVPALGTFLEFPGGATTLLRDYFSGWWSHGLGSAAAAPTGEAIVGTGSALFLGFTGLLRTLSIVGLILLGWIGMWRLTRPLTTQRARITGVLVYAAVALPYNAMATARWAGLFAYAATPFVLSRLARLSRLAPWGPDGGEQGPGVPRRTMLAQVSALSILTAVVSAFVPVFAIVVVLMALGLAAGSALSGGLRGAFDAVVGALGAVVVTFVLHVPWSVHVLGSLGATFGSVPLADPDQRGLPALLRFATGPHGGGALAFLLLVPAAAALLLGREWRLAWAVRAIVLAIGFFAIAYAGDQGWTPAASVAPEVWLAPAAAGLALAGACGALAVDRDVRGTRLTWRQPLGFAAVLAVALGLLPSLGAARDGRWGLGSSDVADALAFLPSSSKPGDYRTLWLGDPRALPQPGWRLADGVAYSLSQNGAPDVRDLWPGDPSKSERLIPDALQLAVTGESSRLGRMLGPMSIRYVIVPLAAGPQSSGMPSYPPPSTLLNTLAGQLDLRQIDIDDNYVVYENDAWIPMRAQLTPSAAAASGQAGFEALVRTDISGSPAIMLDDHPPDAWTGPVTSGTVYLAAPATPRWKLTVAGTTATRHPAFGWANAYDVKASGTARLAYDTPISRPLLVVVQVLLWLAVIALALLRSVPRRRRAARMRHPAAAPGPDVAPLIDLDAEPHEDLAPPVASTRVGGADELLASRALQAALHDGEASANGAAGGDG
jgi:GT2 family glycosyltransferase